jgi:hypothetical protein
MRQNQEFNAGACCDFSNFGGRQMFLGYIPQERGPFVRGERAIRKAVESKEIR